LDREIRVGVPARRADGSGRRTAGRWVAPPAVAAVRFTRPSGQDENFLERDSGRPWEFLGALMTPRGPIGREQAGSPARHPDGALGGCPSQVRAILIGRPRQDRPPTKAGPAQQHPPYPVPTGYRSSSSDPTHLSAPLTSRLGSQLLPVARQVPVLSSPTTVLSRGTARAGWQPPGQGARRTGPEALKFL